MSAFEEGFTFTAKQVGATYSSLLAQNYVHAINKEIDYLSDNLNKFEGFRTGVAQLKGNVAETWHAGTHNINSALSGSSVRANVLESNDFGSVDISTSESVDFGLKYYKTASDSANSQSLSYWQAYNEYIAAAKRNGQSFPTIEEYLANRGVPENTLLTDPVYLEQIRVIPSDQLESAIEFLDRKIEKLMETRPEEVFRYQNTRDNLTDRIESSGGAESIPLSEADARELAELSLNGDFNPADHNLNIESLVNAEHIIEQSLKAGLTAAVITMVLKVAPEIFKSVDLLLKNGEIDREDFQRLGFHALSAASEGFIRGSIAASIMAAGEAGLLGDSFRDIRPEIVGVTTVLVLGTIKNAYFVSQGRMSRREMTDELIRAVYVSTSAVIGGAAMQLLLKELPKIGYLIGSFIGSVFGSYAYSISKKTYISYAIDSGSTCFGLVEQDYTLSDEILERLGLGLFEYERFFHAEFETKTFMVEAFEASTFEPSTIEIVIVRRGVIGVNIVGYQM